MHVVDRNLSGACFRQRTAVRFVVPSECTPKLRSLAEVSLLALAVSVLGCTKRELGESAARGGVAGAAGASSSGDGGTAGSGAPAGNGSAPAGGFSGQSAETGGSSSGASGGGAGQTCQAALREVNTLLGEAKRCAPGSTCSVLENALCGCPVSVADPDSQASVDFIARVRALEAMPGCGWPQCPDGPVPADECATPGRECRAVGTDDQGSCL